MATYGIQTFKYDGEQAVQVLGNGTRGGVFGEVYTITKTGTPGLKPIVSFPKYTGRTIRVFQLKPGPHSWTISYPSGVPSISFYENAFVASSISEFYYDSTALYIFVK